MRSFRLLLNLIFVAGLLIPSGLYPQQATIHVKADQPHDWDNPDEYPYAILLRSRQFVPQPGVEPALLQEPLQFTGVENGRVHILLQLYGPPRQPDMETLDGAGIRLLNYIPRNAWFASIPASNLAITLADTNLTQVIRWAGVIRPEDKVPVDAWEGHIGSWAIAEDGRVRLTVSFFDDIPLEIARQVVYRHNAVIEGEITISNKLMILLQPKEIPTLALEDSVRWLDQVPPPPAVDNDGARAAVNADQVQDTPYNLSGDGVIAGIWDGGAVDWTHNDFFRADGTTRVISRTNTIRDHATHVAGTMSGNGALSETDGGTPRQWRGIAPSVNIVSYDYGNYPDSTDFINDYGEAIPIYNIDLSQNSWGHPISDGTCERYGNYGWGAPELDQIVTGEHEKKIPIVYSAGNERNDGDCGMIGWPDYINYFTINPPKAAKNIITVGAINSNDSTMTTFSSWGPVDDGRLKPEIVAPGCQDDGDWGISSTIPDLFIDILPEGNPDGIDDYDYPYDDACGTSQAAPVVSGISALIIEQFREIYGPGNPWPSTIKALLVQSAHDLDNADFGDQDWYTPGPDYASGYGLVDAKDAVDLVRARSLIQGTIPAIGVVHQHEFWVPPGRNSIKITLAWDDIAATENVSPTLVNDLDLQIVDPHGAFHDPWVLDPEIPEQEAGTGRNFRDNLEQVVVSNPQGLQAGRWVARVVSQYVQQAPQEYSLVSDSFLNILSPGDSQQIYGGSSVEPQQIQIEIPLASESSVVDYHVEIGGQPATINYFDPQADRYVLGVLPAAMPSDGVHDLSVTVNSKNILAVRQDAIQFQGYAISGYVKDHTGAVMEGVRVTAGRRNDETYRQAYTDEFGFYRIEGVPRGTYSVIPQSDTHAFGPQTAVISDHDVTLSDFNGMRLLDGINLTSDIIDIPFDGSTVAHLTALVRNSNSGPVKDTPVYFHTSGSGSINSPVITDEEGKATSTFTPSEVGTVHIYATAGELVSNLVHLEVNPESDSLQTELEIRLHQQTDTYSVYDINGLTTFISNGAPLEHNDIQYTVLDAAGNLFGTLEGGYYSQTGNPITDRTDGYGRSSVYLRVDEDAQVSIRARALGNQNSLVTQVQAGLPPQENLTPFTSLAIPGIVTDLAMSPDGEALVATSSSYDNTRAYNATTYQQVHSFTYPSENFRPAFAADFAGNRSYVAIGTDDASSMNSGLIYDGTSYNYLRGVHYGSAMGQVIAVALSPNGDRLLTLDSHDDRYAQVWNTSNGSLAHTFGSWLSTQELFAGDWSTPSPGYPAGLIAIAQRYDAGYIINGQTYTRIASFNTNLPEDVQWSRDGMYLAVVDYVTASASNIKILNRSGELVTTLPQNFGDIYGLDWAHDSPHLAAASDSGKVTIWNTQSGMLERIIHVGGTLADVQWSADDSEIFVANQGGGISVIALGDGSGPLINISWPADGFETTAMMVTVTGQITDPHFVQSASLTHNNGAPIPLELDSSGNFSEDVLLGEGINLIRIDATDGSGFSSTYDLYVIRLPESPIINIFRVYLPFLKR